jgi:hypothetical protein
LSEIELAARADRDERAAINDHARDGTFADVQMRRELRGRQ